MARIVFWRSGPSTATVAIARMIGGNASIPSTTRMITVSAVRPK